MKKILSILLTLYAVTSTFCASFSVTVFNQTAFDISTATWSISGTDGDGIPDSDDQVTVRLFNSPSCDIQNSTLFTCQDLAFAFLTPATFVQYNVNADLVVTNSINLGGAANFFVFPNQPITIGGSFTNTSNVITFFDFGTIHYNGNSPQQILTSNYGTLQLSGTGNKQISASGASIMTVNTFSPGTSTVEFNSNVAGQVLPKLGAYYNVLLSEADKELGANFAVTNNLEISSSIVLETKSFNLSVGANLILNGGVVNTASELFTFNGSSTTTVSGSETLNVENLIINKATAVTQVVFDSPVEIESGGSLTMTRGALNANGNLALLSSSSTNTARITRIISSEASVSGNITMERFVPSASTTGQFWWHIGTPLSGVAASQLQDDISITGAFTGSATIVGSNNNQSMRTYNETNPSTAMADGWSDFPSSTNSEVMSVGKGYRVYIRDNTTSTVSDYNLDVTGAITTGDFNFGVTYTNSGAPFSDGWNFIANPYPSPIDWGSANWTKTKIEATAYVWDAKQKTYRNVNTLNGNIPSSQGFWVQANGTSPSLIVKETCKKSSTQAFSRPAVVPSNVLEISVIDKNPNGIYNTSLTYLSLDNGALVGKDELDVNQLGRNSSLETWEGSSLLDIATKTVDGYVLRENKMPISTNVEEVPLSITFNDGTNFGFEFHKQNFTEIASIVFKDKYLGTEQLLDDHTYVTFTVDSDLKSKASDRFSLLVSAKPLAVIGKIEKSTFKVYPNPTTSDFVTVSGLVTSQEASIAVSDLNGVLLSETTVLPNKGEVNERIDVSNLEKGLYLLTVRTATDTYTQKIIIE